MPRIECHLELHFVLTDDQHSHAAQFALASLKDKVVNPKLVRALPNYLYEIIRCHEFAVVAVAVIVVLHGERYHALLQAKGTIERPSPE